MFTVPVGFMRVKGGVVVPTDGPSSWYTPETSAHFAALGLNTPDHLWLCQEASGNLAAAIGGVTLTANATGHLYEQTVSGWTRLFVGTDGSTSGQSWRTTSASLDMASGGSYAALALLSFTTTGSPNLYTLGASTELVGAGGAGGNNIRVTHNSVTADIVFDHDNLAVIHQVGWYRRADINLSGGESDLGGVGTTHAELAKTGAIKSIGPAGAFTPASARYGWYAVWVGTNAEFSMAQYLARLSGNIHVHNKASVATTTDATTNVTASVQPAPDCVVYAAVVSGVTVGPPNVPTASGNGLTWVEVGNVLFGAITGNTHRLTVFRSLGSAPTAGAITFDFGGQTQESMAHSIVQCSDVDTSGTNGSGATPQSDTSTSGSTAVTTINATLASALQSSKSVMLTFVATNLNSAVTPDAQFTEMADVGAATPAIRIECEFAINQTVCDPTFSSAQAGAVAVEVKRDPSAPA